MKIPNSKKTEQAVLAALLLTPQDIVEVGFLSSHMFFDPRHKLLFETLQQLWERHGTYDMLTIAKHLQSQGSFEKTGGIAYISEVAQASSYAQTIQQHARHLQELQIRRDIILKATQLSQKAMLETEDVFDLVNNFDQISQSLNDTAALGGSVRHISHALDATYQELEKRAQIAKEGGVVGIPTGVREYDLANRGFQRSNLVILAARPGMGKTALALHCMLTAAKNGHHVCYFSLEMSKIELTQRLIQALSYADSDRMRSGLMTDEDWGGIMDAGEQLNKLPISIDDTANISISYIKNQARSLHKKKKCDMVVIDYLQLMRPDEKKQIREQEVADMSRNAKILAKELDIPVILLCQLSREVEKRGDRIPVLSDLRESGAIEQDADVVLFIYRPEYYGYKEDDFGNKLTGAGKLIIAKNRAGKVENVNFTYNHNLTKFDKL